MANAVRPGAASPSAQRPLRQGDTYQPAVTPAVSDSLLTPRTPVPGAALGTRSWGKAPPRGPGFPFLGSRRSKPILGTGCSGAHGASHQLEGQREGGGRSEPGSFAACLLAPPPLRGSAAFPSATWEPRGATSSLCVPCGLCEGFTSCAASTCCVGTWLCQLLLAGSWVSRP